MADLSSDAAGELEIKMPVDGKLLEILCCPTSKTPLTVLGQEKLDKLNTMINSGEALYVDGAKVKDPLTEGLITEEDYDSERQEILKQF